MAVAVAAHQAQPGFDVLVSPVVVGPAQMDKAPVQQAHRLRDSRWGICRALSIPAVSRARARSVSPAQAMGQAGQQVVQGDEVQPAGLIAQARRFLGRGQGRAGLPVQGQDHGLGLEDLAAQVRAEGRVQGHAGDM